MQEVLSIRDINSPGIATIPDTILFNEIMTTPKFKVVIGSEDANATLFLDWNTFTNGVAGIEYVRRNESLLLEALKNSVRKINFSDLNNSLEDEDITEEEYGNELEKNSDKYAISIANIKYPSDIYNIIDIVEKMGYLRDFTLSEVSEMFSIKEDQLVSLARLNR